MEVKEQEDQCRLGIDFCVQEIILSSLLAITCREDNIDEEKSIFDEFQSNKEGYVPVRISIIFITMPLPFLVTNAKELLLVGKC